MFENEEELLNSDPMALLRRVSPLRNAGVPQALGDVVDLEQAAIDAEYSKNARDSDIVNAFRQTRTQQDIGEQQYQKLRAQQLEDAAAEENADRRIARGLREFETIPVYGSQEFTKAQDKGDYGQYITNTVGSAAASMLDPAIGGLLGSAAGTVLSRDPRVRAVSGLLGAAIPGYSLNRGEQASTIAGDEQLSTLSVDDKVALSQKVGLRSALLDAAVPAYAVLGGRMPGALGRLGPTGRVATAALGEGVTEAAQDVVSQTAEQGYFPDRELDIESLVNSAMAGIIGGGAIGGVSALVGPRAPGDEQQGQNPRGGIPPLDESGGPLPGSSDGPGAVFEDTPANNPGAPIDLNDPTVADNPDLIDDTVKRASEAIDLETGPSLLDRARTAVDSVLGDREKRSAERMAAGIEDPSIAGETDAEINANIDQRIEENTPEAQRLAQLLLLDERTPANVREFLEQNMDIMNDPTVQKRVGQEYLAFRQQNKQRNLVGSLLDSARTLTGNERASREGVELAPSLQRDLVTLLSPEAQANDDVVNNLSEIAQVLMKFAITSGQLTKKDINLLTKVYAARDLFRDPQAVAERLAEAGAQDIQTGRNVLRELWGENTAVADFETSGVNSFVSQMLPPSKRDSITTGEVKQLAQLIDQYNLTAPNGGKSEQALAIVRAELGKLFGSVQRADMVVNYYLRERNDTPLGRNFGVDTADGVQATEQESANFDVSFRNRNSATPFLRGQYDAERDARAAELGPSAEVVSADEAFPDSFDAKTQVGRIQRALETLLEQDMVRDPQARQNILDGANLVLESDPTNAEALALKERLEGITDKNARTRLPQLRAEYTKLRETYDQAVAEGRDPDKAVLALYDVVRTPSSDGSVATDNTLERFRGTIGRTFNVKTSSDAQNVVNAKKNELAQGSKLTVHFVGGKKITVSARDMTMNSAARGSYMEQFMDSYAALLARPDVEQISGLSTNTPLMWSKDGEVLQMFEDIPGGGRSAARVSAAQGDAATAGGAKNRHKQKPARAEKPLTAEEKQARAKAEKEKQDAADKTKTAQRQAMHERQDQKRQTRANYDKWARDGLVKIKAQIEKTKKESDPDTDVEAEFLRKVTDLSRRAQSGLAAIQDRIQGLVSLGDKKTKQEWDQFNQAVEDQRKAFATIRATNEAIRDTLEADIPLETREEFDSRNDDRVSGNNLNDEDRSAHGEGHLALKYGEHKVEVMAERLEWAVSQGLVDLTRSLDAELTEAKLDLAAVVNETSRDDRTPVGGSARSAADSVARAERKNPPLPAELREEIAAARLAALRAEYKTLGREYKDLKSKLDDTQDSKLREKLEDRMGAVLAARDRVKSAAARLDPTPRPMPSKRPETVGEQEFKALQEQYSSTENSMNADVEAARAELESALGGEYEAQARENLEHIKGGYKYALDSIAEAMESDGSLDSALVSPKRQFLRRIYGVEIDPTDANAKASREAPKRGRPARVTPEEKAAIEEVVARIRGTKNIVVEIEKTAAELGATGLWGTKVDKDNTPIRIIQIAVNAKNKLSVAYHESLHDFFGGLGYSRDSRLLKKQLLDAAGHPRIMRYMKNAFKDSPGVLEDLRNIPEERLAYAFQLWEADPVFRGLLTPRADTFFTKMAAFLRGIIGAVSKEEKMGEVFGKLHSGAFSEMFSGADVIAKLEKKTASERMRNLSPALYDAAGQLFGFAADNLRNTGIEEMSELADLFYKDRGGLGMIQRRQKNQNHYLARMARALERATPGQRMDTLRRLQSMKGPRPGNELDNAIHRLLRDMHDYMGKAGVKNYGTDPKTGAETVNPLGFVENYFPRSWSARNVRENADEFRTLLGKYGVEPEQQEAIITAVTTGNGQFDLAANEKHLGFSPYNQAVKNRRLTFITPENAHEFVKFQNDDITDILGTYISQAAHRAEYARSFGDRGEVIAALLSAASDKGLEPKEKDRVEKNIAALEGTVGAGMNPVLRDVMGGIVSVQNMALLPLAIFAQMVDPLGAAVRTSDVSEAGRGYVRALKELKAHVDKEGPGASRRLAEKLGIIDDNSMLEAMGYVNGSIHMGKAITALNKKFFHYNGMQGWNNSMRIAAMESGISYIKKHRGDSRRMAELGLTSKDVKLDEKGNLKIDSQKMQEALYGFVDQSVLRPSSAQRPAWMSDPHFMLLAHLKQFSFSFHKVTLGEVSNAMKHGDEIPAKILALYAPVVLASSIARWVLTGSMPTSWDFLDYTEYAFERSGVAGRYDLGLQAVGDMQAGRGPLTSFLGPAYDHLTTIGHTLFGRGTAENLIDRTVPLVKYF